MRKNGQLMNYWPCVQEEKKSKLEKPESAHLISQLKGNAKKGKITLKVKKYRNMSIKQLDKNNQYFFCKKWGHVKKDCYKY